MTPTVSSVCGFEQSTTGVRSTQSSCPRLLAGVFRHCPSLGGGGTSSATADCVGQAAPDGRVRTADAAELASSEQAAHVAPTTMMTSTAAARTSFVMSCSPPFSVALVLYGGNPVAAASSSAGGSDQDPSRGH